MRISASFSLGLTMVLAGVPLAGCGRLQSPFVSDKAPPPVINYTPKDEVSQAVPPAPRLPPNAEGMLKLAADIEARGEKPAAANFYQRAVEASNGDVGVHLRAGEAFLRLGYPVPAANAFRVVIAREAENGRALLGLGTALVKSGQVDEGLPYLTKAVRIVNTASAYDRLGVANVLAGRQREALASFEQAHAIDGRDLDIGTNLALSAALLEQHDKAVNIMRKVAASPDATTQHKRNLVLVLGMAGRASEARASARDLPPETVRSLLEQANGIRGISNPKAKALALGTASTSAQ